MTILYLLFSLSKKDWIVRGCWVLQSSDMRPVKTDLARTCVPISRRAEGGSGDNFLPLDTSRFEGTRLGADRSFISLGVFELSTNRAIGNTKRLTCQRPLIDSALLE